MTAVKICGITNPEDAFAACDYGAEALGFIFYEPSPRYLKPMEAKKIIQRLPANIAKIGVFVNPEISLIRRYMGIFAGWISSSFPGMKHRISATGFRLPYCSKPCLPPWERPKAR